MHGIDQSIRLLLGIVLIYIGFVDVSIIGDRFFSYLIGGFGILNLVSGAFGVCPVYMLAGIQTRKPTSG